MRHEIQIDGHNIYKIEDFFSIVHEIFSFPTYISKDLDGFLDGLTTHVDPNLTIYWLNHETCKKRLGNDFERIIEVLDRVKSYHKGFNYLLN